MKNTTNPEPPPSASQDIQGLKLVCKGIEMTSPEMRKVTLEFAWDKYVSQPFRESLKKERLK